MNNFQIRTSILFKNIYPNLNEGLKDSIKIISDLKKL